jgi:carbon-monoxide dehydrogenase medium subunit
MLDTRYHRPASLAEATALFSGAAEARYLSGGQTLIPTMKQRLAGPSDLIDIARLPDLRGIEATASGVSIGAAMTHAEVAASAVVRQAIPGLAGLAGVIGDPAVRQMGTLGGSIANNDPAADYPAALLALGATVHTDRRAIAAADFFTGLFATALADGEIVVKVDFPAPLKSAYEKFRNPASRYAMAGAFVARMKDGSVRVGIAGAGDTGAFRATAMEDALAKSWSPAAVDGVAVDEAAMLADIHAGAAYRANLVKVMVRRAVAAIG